VPWFPSLHAGIRGRVSRSTLADANELRDWRIYADLAMGLIRHARTLYRNQSLDVGIDLQQPAYAFDSTTIDLCLKLFPWRSSDAEKALSSSTPSSTCAAASLFHPCFRRKNGRCQVAGLSADRAGFLLRHGPRYIDFARLWRFTQNLAFFVTRAKKGIDYKRQCWREVDQSAAAQRHDHSPVRTQDGRLYRGRCDASDTGTRNWAESLCS